MRGNLTISSFLIAVFILAITVVPARADFSWSGNAISITEFGGPTGLSSVCNAKRNGYPMGGWTSTAGVLPQVVAAPGMTYEMTLKTVGILRIEEAILTPDSGLTCWQANLIPNKGYTVSLPLGYGTVRTLCKVPRLNHPDKFDSQWLDVPSSGLPTGEMSGVEWRVKSRDQHNRLVIFIIPISWSSTRTTCTGSAIMVQQAPDGFDSLSNLMVFACLRGFVPAWAIIDPAVLVQQQMVNGGGIPQPQPILPPTPSVQQPQTYQPPIQPKPIYQAPKPERGDQLSGVQVDGYVETRVPAKATRQLSSVTIIVWKGEESQTWRHQVLDLSRYQAGQIVEFRNGRQVVAAAEVNCVKNDLLEMQIFKGNWPTCNNLFVVVEEGDK